jgi:hypothetical protein
VNCRAHRLWALAPLLIVLGLGLAGCARSQIAADPVPPTQLKLIPGTSLHYVTLSQQAMLDLGVRTQSVRRAPSSAAAASPSSAVTATPSPGVTAAAPAHPGALTVMPLAAVIYDPQGRSWTYAIAAPRTFVRRAIVIDRIDGDEALLRSGPPVGTPVVTVGAPELLGAEYGVGEE